MSLQPCFTASFRCQLLKHRHDSKSDFCIMKFETRDIIPAGSESFFVDVYQSFTSCYLLRSLIQCVCSRAEDPLLPACTLMLHKIMHRSLGQVPLKVGKKAMCACSGNENVVVNFPPSFQHDHWVCYVRNVFCTREMHTCILAMPIESISTGVELNR